MAKTVSEIMLLMLLLGILVWISDAHSFTTQENGETKTITAEAIADAYVSNDEKGSGTADLLQVRYLVGYMWNSYVMFDLSKIPLYVDVESVEFQIKVDSFGVELDNWVSAFITSSDWSETDINWDNKPGKISFLGSKKIALFEDWYSWGELSLIEAVEEAVHQEHNLSIGLESSFLEWCLVEFLSRESGNAPRLLVTYKLDLASPSINIPSIQPNNPTPDDEVTLRISVNDSYSGVKDVFLCYSINSTTDWNKVQMTSKGDSSYEGTIPKQGENTTVYYYIEAYDNAGNRQKSSMRSYTSRFLNVPLWIIVVAGFIVLGIAVIGIIGVIYFFRKRRQSIEIN
jgi:hypothetical protein